MRFYGSLKIYKNLYRKALKRGRGFVFNYKSFKIQTANRNSPFGISTWTFFFANHALLPAGNVGESNQNSFPYSLPIQHKMSARHKTNEQKKNPLPELKFFQSNREAKHKTVNFGGIVLPLANANLFLQKDNFMK